MAYGVRRCHSRQGHLREGLRLVRGRGSSIQGYHRPCRKGRGGPRPPSRSPRRSRSWRALRPSRSTATGRRSSAGSCARRARSRQRTTWREQAFSASLPWHFGGWLLLSGIGEEFLRAGAVRRPARGSAADEPDVHLPDRREHQQRADRDHPRAELWRFWPLICWLQPAAAHAHAVRIRVRRDVAQVLRADDPPALFTRSTISPTSRYGSTSALTRLRSPSRSNALSSERRSS